MTDQEEAEMFERDLICNMQADMEDLRTGRIRDIEHLCAVDTLLDVVGEFENSVTCVSQGNFDLYGFINSKSMKELESIFKRVGEMTAEFDSLFGLDCNTDTPEY